MGAEDEAEKVAPVENGTKAHVATAKPKVSKEDESLSSFTPSDNEKKGK